MLKDNLGDKTCGAGCDSKDICIKTKLCPDKWMAAIVPEIHTPQRTWKNSITNEWPSEPWQLAKIFMGPGQDPLNVDPQKTDALGLLQLMINCRKFHSLLDTDKAKEVR